MADSATTNTAQILLVDDEENILRAITRLLMDQEDVQVLTASCGEDGLKLLQANPDVAVILSDQRMPGLSGAEFLQQARNIAPEAIRMVLTGYADINATMDAINKGGAACYITKPWDDGLLLQTLKEGIQRYQITMENKRLSALVQQQNLELQEWNLNLKNRVLEQTSRIRQQMEELRHANESATRNWQNTILAFSSVLGLLDPLARNHSQNVCAISEEMGRSLGMPAEEVEAIRVAALLHDIGKIGIDPGILRKPLNMLNDGERAEYTQHPVRGQAVVDMVEGLRAAGILIRHHHERYDGKGFPDALRGDAIPAGARIIAVADYMDETISRFDAATALEAALEKARAVSGTLFDPAMLPTLADIVRTRYANLADREHGEERELLPKDLCVGMVLASEVTSGTGLLLLNKGAIIDEARIQSLKRYYQLDPPERGVFVYVPGQGKAP